MMQDFQKQEEWKVASYSILAIGKKKCSLRISITLHCSLYKFLFREAYKVHFSPPASSNNSIGHIAMCDQERNMNYRPRHWYLDANITHLRMIERHHLPSNFSLSQIIYGYTWTVIGVHITHNGSFRYQKWPTLVYMYRKVIISSTIQGYEKNNVYEKSIYTCVQLKSMQPYL